MDEDAQAANVLTFALRERPDTTITVRDNECGLVAWRLPPNVTHVLSDAPLVEKEELFSLGTEILRWLLSSVSGSFYLTNTKKGLAGIITVLDLLYASTVSRELPEPRALGKKFNPQHTALIVLHMKSSVYGDFPWYVPEGMSSHESIVRPTSGDDIPVFVQVALHMGLTLIIDTLVTQLRSERERKTERLKAVFETTSLLIDGLKYRGA